MGEGEFELVEEVKESEYVTPHDEVLGTLTVSFTVTPNFALSLTKLENQYDTKNLPALMSIVSQVQYPCHVFKLKYSKLFIRSSMVGALFLVYLL